MCSVKQCEFGCKMTSDGPKCFCPEGQQPEHNKCVGKI